MPLAFLIRLPILLFSTLVVVVAVSSFDREGRRRLTPAATRGP